MIIKLTEILEIDKINTLLKSYTEATGLVSALLDLDGNILSKSGWKEICVEFHRKNPETAKYCRKSDTELANKLSQGGKFNVYKCVNGLIDVAVPIIVKGQHIGNLFTGQFLFESPDKKFFREQAQKYNFEEVKYLNALSDVPIIKEEEIRSRLNFLLHMTEVIAEIGLSRIQERESKEALEQNEKKYQSFFENMNEGFALHEIILDEDGKPIDYRFLEVNSTFAKMTGIESDKVTGQTVRKCFPGIENDPANWIEKYGNVALTGEEISFEDYSEGVERWFLVHAFCPKKGQFAVSFTDITQRKEMEVRLFESEKHNQILLDSLPIGLALCRLDGSLVSVNPAYAKIIGRSIEETLKLSYWDITPKKYEKQEQEQLDKLDNFGYYEAYEKEYIHKNGNLIPVRLSGIYIEKDGEKYIWSSIEEITKQRIAENRLKQSETKFAMAFNTSPYLITITQIEDGKFIDVNRAFTTITGYSREEAINSSSINLNIWGDINHRNQIVADLNVKKRLDKIEAVFRKKSGETFVGVLSANIVQLYGKDCVLTSIEDVSERIHSEKELRNSETKFRALVEQSITGIYIFAKDRFIYVNQRFTEIFGYTEQEVLSSLKPTDVVEKEEKARAQDNIDMRLENRQKSVHYIARGKRKDNKPLWIEIHGSSIELDGEQVITGTVLDITDKYKALEEIKNSENQFRTLFEQAAIGVAIIDSKTGAYRSVNQKHCNIIGYTESELLQSNFKQITHSDDLEKDLHLMKQLISGEINSFTMEKRYFHKNGSIVWVALNVSPLWKKGETPDSHIAVVEDITERKAIEVELRKYREKLEDLVKDRTDELEQTNKKLVKNINELERFNELFVDREFRIKELKQEIKLLKGS